MDSMEEACEVAREGRTEGSLFINIIFQMTFHHFWLIPLSKGGGVLKGCEQQKAGSLGPSYCLSQVLMVMDAVST